MDWFLELVGNPYLITALSAWFFAQVIKTILHAVMNGGFSLSRFFFGGIRQLPPLNFVHIHNFQWVFQML